MRKKIVINFDLEPKSKDLDNTIFDISNIDMKGTDAGIPIELFTEIANRISSLR